MIVIRPRHIFFGFGGGEDNNPDGFEIRIFFDDLQNIDAIHMRQAQIEQDDK